MGQPTQRAHRSAGLPADQMLPTSTGEANGTWPAYWFKCSPLPLPPGTQIPKDVLTAVCPRLGPVKLTPKINHHSASDSPLNILFL
jgi:hypothetical protein